MSQPCSPNQEICIDHPDDLSELVKTCGSKGQPIVDYGVAHRGLGYSPPNEHVRLTQCGTVLEHDQRDLVVRVAAGTTVSELQTVLNTADQFLPIDADDDLTIGEVIQHNVYGPLRVGFGAARDWLLGLRYIDGMGNDIHVGGRTVKNVAGYDVSRLLIGSLGELGCAYEVTLQTSALPEAAATAEIILEDMAQIDLITTDLIAGDAAPSCLSLESRTHSSVMSVGYLGHADSCRTQLQMLESWVSSIPHLRAHQTHLCAFEQDTHHRTCRRQWRRKATGLVKLVVPPASTGQVCQTMKRNFSAEADISLDALPADGCLFVGGAMDAPACYQLNQLIGEIVTPIGGLWAWYAKPPNTASIASFSPPQADWTWLAKLKKTMDPRGLFNPGRFLPIGVNVSP